MTTDQDPNKIEAEGTDAPLADPDPAQDPAKDPATDPDPKNDPEDPETDPAILSKAEQLANLDKAIDEANDKLRKKREALKSGKVDEDDDEDNDELEINLKDPNSKAWDKHIKKTVDPALKELDAEKQELFKYTLQEFLVDKPALYANPEKLQAVIETYGRIRNNTGRVKEGIINDLQRAFAAEHHEELQNDKTKVRVDKARKEAIYADPGVSRGAGNYQPEREITPVYSDQDAKILAKWNMTPEEHSKMTKEMQEKRDAE